MVVQEETTRLSRHLRFELKKTFSFSLTFDNWGHPLYKYLKNMHHCQAKFLQTDLMC